MGAAGLWGPRGAAPCDLALALASDDTGAWHEGRSLAVPAEVILARRLAGRPSTPVRHHTWKSLRSALTAAYSMSEHNTVYGTSSYFKTAYKYKLLQNNRTENTFVVVCFVFFKAREKMRLIRASAAITHSLIERQRLDTLAASGLKRKSRAWLPD